LLLLSIGKLDLPLPNSPPPSPPEFIGAAASRIYHGAPAIFDRSQPKKLRQRGSGV